MADDTSNDNDSGPGDDQVRVPQPDVHGQAAILLVESLIHGLVVRSVISTADAVEIVASAYEVKAAIGAALGDSPETIRKSLAILEAIRASLAIDL
jgi:hypothetical protein